MIVTPTFRRTVCATLAAAILAPLTFKPAEAQVDYPVLGEIAYFGLNYCPRGWLVPAGQTVYINDNNPDTNFEALAGLLQSPWGMVNQTQIKLPNLLDQFASAAPPGSAPGALSGVETVTLDTTHLAAHSHAIYGGEGDATTPDPENGYFASYQDSPRFSHFQDAPGRPNGETFAMHPSSVSQEGIEQGSYSTRHPFTRLTPCMNVNGRYPMRGDPDQFIDRTTGEIILLPYDLNSANQPSRNHCPAGTSVMAGQMLRASVYSELYVYLGETWGGANDGTQFQLPTAQNRVPVGQDDRTIDFSLGAYGGVTEHATVLDTHRHELVTAEQVGNQASPLNNLVGEFQRGRVYAGPDSTDNLPMSPHMLTATGEGQPIPNTAPTTSLMYCLVVTGNWPQHPQ